MRKVDFEFTTWWRGVPTNLGGGWGFVAQSPDALAFVSKINCIVFGFGIIGPQDERVDDGWQLKIRLILNGKQASEIIFTANSLVKDGKFYRCLFENHGGKRIPLKRGDKLEIEQTFYSGVKANHYYLKNCSANGIDSQPYHFEVQQSNLSKNGTGPTSGQIPCLYYLEQ